jgi:NADPH:quinone reductase-like Zn-dependent oxidoreductase
MKAAIIPKADSTPVYNDFREPAPSDREVHIAVSAAALSPVVKARAAGAHYSSPGDFPLVVGIDGVGRLEDGRRVYFILPRAPFGSMAERTVAPASQCVAVPEGLDDVTAAAIPNPGLSSWAALKDRAKFAAGETVLVNGATGTSGRLAVQIARHLGAGRIIATGRNAAALESVKALGADETIVLTEDTETLDGAFKEHFARGVDVVLDYLWGKSAERMLVTVPKVVKEGIRVRFVQLGHSSGANITLPAMALRSAAVELTGSGLGSVPLLRIVEVVGEVLQAAATARFDVPIKAMPLSQVEQVWRSDRMVPRVVFTTGQA